MKSSRAALLSWFDQLSIFAGSFDSPTTYDYRLRRAREEIEQLKRTYRNKSLSFDYHHETIRGRFVTAIEGDFGGTYMIVLKIVSSRICSGPCFVHLHGGLVGGIVVTGEGGLVGITAKAVLQKRTTALRHCSSGASGSRVVK
jgi:hypothetical protein